MEKLLCAFGVVTLFSCTAAASLSWKNNSSVSASPDIVENFHNPILDFVSPDPQMLYLDGFYYMVLSSNIWPYNNGGILVYK